MGGWGYNRYSLTNSYAGGAAASVNFYYQADIPTKTDQYTRVMRPLGNTYTLQQYLSRLGYSVSVSAYMRPGLYGSQVGVIAISGTKRGYNLSKSSMQYEISQAVLECGFGGVGNAYLNT